MRTGQAKPKRSIRRQKIVNSFGMILTIYLLMFSASTFFGRVSKVSAVSKTKEIQVFVDSVLVKRGDTLWSIAKRYHSEFYPDVRDYVQAIKECNGILEDKIQSGSVLMVPYTESH